MMDIDKFIVDRDAYQTCEENIRLDILSGQYNQNLVSDFMVIGAPRCGTTLLSEVLKQVPSAFVAQQKELKFFSANLLNFDYAWYLSQFVGGIGKLKGEATPSYASLPISRIRLIYEMNPQLKLIYIIREPRERLTSDWKHTSRNRENCSENEVLSYVLSDGPVVASDYAENLSRWLSVFPKEQLLILFYDELQAESKTFLDRVMNFLGLSVNLDLIRTDRVNYTWKDEYVQEIIDRIYPALFAPRIRTLRALLDEISPDLDLPGWLELDTSGSIDNAALAFDLNEDRSISVIDGYYVCGPRTIIWDFKQLEDALICKRPSVGVGYYLFEAISSSLIKENIVENRLLALCHGDQHPNDLFFVRENYFGWNIMFYRGRFFGARISIGHFDLRDIDTDQLNLFLQSGNMKVFNTLQDALTALSKNGVCT